MKELGEYLKEQRVSNGVGVDEAAGDLSLTSDDIENIESGNIKAFKDVLELKEYVRNYAKYLGLDSEKVVDEFNDFLFEHTSRISLDDILDIKKKQEEEEEKKIHSPYTFPKKEKLTIEKMLKLKPLFKALLVVLLLLLILYVFIKVFNGEKEEKRTVELLEIRSEIYEFAK